MNRPLHSGFYGVMPRFTDGPRLTLLDADSDVWVISVPHETALKVELTIAEAAIAQALTEGATTKEIAAARGTSTRTVANQIRAIFIKAGVNSRTELLAVLHGGQP